MLDKHPTCTLRIRWQDCDPFGHLNNARYLNYFLDARDEHLRHAYGFDIQAYAAQKHAGWVVSTHKIAYLGSARPGEVVLVRSRLIGLTADTLHVEAVMTDYEEMRPKAVLSSSFRHVDLRTGKPTKHDDDIRAFLDSILVEGNLGTIPFEERVMQLRAQYAKPVPAVV
jgi:YbgC/YbaW family acyl-CoA thioester hydrolase